MQLAKFIFSPLLRSRRLLSSDPTGISRDHRGEHVLPSTLWHFCLTFFLSTIIDAHGSSIQYQHPSPEPESFVFGELNQPFAPSDRRNAKKILAETDHDYHHHERGLSSVRRTLINSWREVSEHTVHHTHSWIFTLTSRGTGESNHHLPNGGMFYGSCLGTSRPD